MVELDDDVNLMMDQYPGLMAVRPFLAMAENMPWFRSVGEQFPEKLISEAENYAYALGFPEAQPAFVPDWMDAADSLETLGVNAPAWEAEEQLRASLMVDLIEAVGDEVLEMVLNHVSEVVTEPIKAAAEEAAEYLRISDEEFVQAAIGTGVQACHQAAMVAMSEAGEQHPFAIRFRLFEAGRWPLGIIGTSFLIF